MYRTLVAAALWSIALLPWEARAQAVDPQPADASREATVQRSEAPSAGSEEPSAIDRWRDRYAHMKDKGISITLGSIMPGASFSAGAQLRRDRLFGTSIGGSVGASWSVRGYHVYDLKLGRIKGSDHRTELRPVDADLTSVFNDRSLLAFGTSLFLDVRQRVFPRMDYFGLGQGTTVDERTDYKITGPSIDVVGQWQRKHLGMSGRFGRLDLKLGTPTNSNVPDIQTLRSAEAVPGIDVQHRYRVAGAGVTVDFRDAPYLTTSGTFLGVALWHLTPSDVHEERGAWTRLVVDVRQFVPIRTDRQQVALRFLTSTVLGHTLAPTPFYLQPTLGGSKTLRGFGSYRLRGDAAWSANAEYRWRVHKRLEVAPFFDFGAVAGSFSGLGAADIEASPGIGLRAVAGDRVIGRLDFAHSRDGARVAATVSTAF